MPPRYLCYIYLLSWTAQLERKSLSHKWNLPESTPHLGCLLWRYINSWLLSWTVTFPNPTPYFFPVDWEGQPTKLLVMILWRKSTKAWGLGSTGKAFGHCHLNTLPNELHKTVFTSCRRNDTKSEEERLYLSHRKAWQNKRREWLKWSGSLKIITIS